jgi:hypothetical protein
MATKTVTEATHLVDESGRAGAVRQGVVLQREATRRFSTAHTRQCPHSHC